jgi:hypothetical protein
MSRLNGVKPIVLTLFAAAVFCAPVFAQQTKTFENSQLKYAVKYPADYQLKHLGRVVVFTSPVVDKKTGFSDNVNIASEELSGMVNLEDFFNRAKSNLTVAGAAVKVLDEKKDKLSGADAYRIIYTSKQKRTGFKFLQVVSIHKNKAFVVTYTALESQFDRGLAQANALIKSLKFSD